MMSMFIDGCLRQQIVCNESYQQICCKVIHGTVPCVFALTGVLQFVVGGLYDCPVSEHELVQPSLGSPPSCWLPSCWTESKVPWMPLT